MESPNTRPEVLLHLTELHFRTEETARFTRQPSQNPGLCPSSVLWFTSLKLYDVQPDGADIPSVRRAKWQEILLPSSIHSDTR